MDQVDLTPQVEDLEANIDELEDALEPLLKSPLLTTASTLPLLDKAKLYVLTSYAIESILFSTLQASGVNAKEHAVFAELARLKSYFKKIKDAELGPEPKTRIDKAAVGRFVRHGLAGNDKYDAERAERVAKEKARAALKAKQMNKKFDEAEESARMAALPKNKRVAEDAESSEEEEDEENDVDSENLEMYGDEVAAEKEGDSSSRPARKKQRKSLSDLNDAYDKSVSSPSAPNPSSASISKPLKQSKRYPGGGKRRSRHSIDSSDGTKSQDQRKTERRAARKERRALRSEKNAELVEKDPELVIPPSEAPRIHSETFNALLDGSLKKNNSKKGKGK
jgi:exosome complex protein LRP1